MRLVDTMTFKAKKMLFETSEDMEVFVKGNKKQTVMQQYERTAKKEVCNVQNSIDLMAGDTLSMVAKDTNMQATQSDVKINAANKVYIQGVNGIETDS